MKLNGIELLLSKIEHICFEVIKLSLERGAFIQINSDNGLIFNLGVHLIIIIVSNIS